MGGLDLLKKKINFRNEKVTVVSNSGGNNPTPLPTDSVVVGIVLSPLFQVQRFAGPESKVATLKI